jgi:hypothetical protein
MISLATYLYDFYVSFATLALQLAYTPPAEHLESSVRTHR